MKQKPFTSPSRFVSKIDEEFKALKRSKKLAKIYYHSRRLSSLGYKVDVKNRIFESPYSSLGEFPVPARYYAGMLIRMGFNHQNKLFS